MATDGPLLGRGDCLGLCLVPLQPPIPPSTALISTENPSSAQCVAVPPGTPVCSLPDKGNGSTFDVFNTLPCTFRHKGADQGPRCWDTPAELMAQEGRRRLLFARLERKARLEEALSTAEHSPTAGKKLGISTCSPRCTNGWGSAPGALLLAGGSVGWRQSFCASARPW